MTPGAFGASSLTDQAPPRSSPRHPYLVVLTLELLKLGNSGSTLGISLTGVANSGGSGIENEIHSKNAYGVA